MSKQKTLKIYRDQDCPKCGFPETMSICNAETLDLIAVECTLRSRKKCDWKYKIPKKAKLEPCPFCGQGYFFNLTKVERTRCRQVECVSCGAKGPVGENNKDAGHRWGIRQPNAGNEIKDGDTIIGPDGKESVARKYKL